MKKDRRLSRKDTIRINVDKSFAKKMKMAALRYDMTIVGFTKRLAEEDAPSKAGSGIVDRSKKKKGMFDGWNARI